jgi:hypothetical protein
MKGRNSKTQTPNSKETSNFKLQQSRAEQIPFPSTVKAGYRNLTGEISA